MSEQEPELEPELELAQPPLVKVVATYASSSRRSARSSAR